ncbi:MAG: hypothetical protein H6741_21130 [Alphaproteobacteria bacterium]|nr:hypothetical protein [Alphaproteobacteria bacterium]
MSWKRFKAAFRSRSENEQLFRERRALLVKALDDSQAILATRRQKGIPEDYEPLADLARELAERRQALVELEVLVRTKAAEASVKVKPELALARDLLHRLQELMGAIELLISAKASERARMESALEPALREAKVLIQRELGDCPAVQALQRTLQAMERVSAFPDMAYLEAIKLLEAVTDPLHTAYTLCREIEGLEGKLDQDSDSLALFSATIAARKAWEKLKLGDYAATRDAIRELRSALAIVLQDQG